MLLTSQEYKNEIIKVSKTDFISWDKLKNSSILITGATGLIGSYLIDVLMYLNSNNNLNCKIYALSRNKEEAIKKFSEYVQNLNFVIIEADINSNIEISEIKKIDYIIHLASNTHPKAYATDPIGTITTNVIGTKNIFDFGYEHDCKKILFSSSCEIYGENKGDTEKFDEKYLGYIDCNTLRAGYTESKRCGEALCQAYISQMNMNIVIARLARIFGPTMLKNDSKALSQFIKNGVNKKSIVLKSEGNQYYSYLYVADAVTGILLILLEGINGEAYNIADEACDIRLKELASIIADIVGTKVIYELPDETEKKGFSKATKALLNNEKIKELKWHRQFELKEMLAYTINNLKN